MDRFRRIWYEVSSSSTAVRKLREDLFMAISGASPAAITNLPATAGNSHREWRVHITTIERRDRVLTIAALAPLNAYNQRDAVLFRLSDVTDTTSIATFDALTTSHCRSFPLTTDPPEADIYWVLDQSGSMRSFNDVIRNFSGQIYGLLQNTGIDFRLGVTNMNAGSGGRLRPQAGWHTDPTTFSREIEEYVIDCDANVSGCATAEEYGLWGAEHGIRYMRSSNAAPRDRIRPGAKLITIFMTDERPESVQDAELPDGTRIPSGTLMNTYRDFFKKNTARSYAIVGDSNGQGCGLQDGEEYRQIAAAASGASASLCSRNLTDTITTITDEIAAVSSTYRLSRPPISSTLRVYIADEDKVSSLWVPRSRTNGFDYSAQENSLSFYGQYAPKAASKRSCSIDAECPAPDDEICLRNTCELRNPRQLAVHYRAWKTRDKPDQGGITP